VRLFYSAPKSQLGCQNVIESVVQGQTKLTPHVLLAFARWQHQSLATFHHHHHHLHHHHHHHHHIIIIIIINLLAQKHDRVIYVQRNKASGTARTLTPLIAALEKYK